MKFKPVTYLQKKIVPFCLVLLIVLSTSCIGHPLFVYVHNDTSESVKVAYDFNEDWKTEYDTIADLTCKYNFLRYRDTLFEAKFLDAYYYPEGTDILFTGGKYRPTDYIYEGRSVESYAFELYPGQGVLLPVVDDYRINLNEITLFDTLTYKLEELHNIRKTRKKETPNIVVDKRWFSTIVLDVKKTY